VIIDLRPGSPTFKNWYGLELSAENHRALYVPVGIAHGFQTLVDNTEVFYQMSEFYHPECAHGMRWDDPAFNVKWPIEASVMSEKDKSYPAWSRQ
jgi:dTDP-4-dehydrorhamnose 3,5-epimerase